MQYFRSQNLPSSPWANILRSQDYASLYKQFVGEVNGLMNTYNNFYTPPPDYSLITDAQPIDAFNLEEIFIEILRFGPLQAITPYVTEPNFSIFNDFNLSNEEVQNDIYLFKTLYETLDEVYRSGFASYRKDAWVTFFYKCYLVLKVKKEELSLLRKNILEYVPSIFGIMRYLPIYDFQEFFSQDREESLPYIQFLAFCSIIMGDMGMLYSCLLYNPFILDFLPPQMRFNILTQMNVDFLDQDHLKEYLEMIMKSVPSMKNIYINEYLPITLRTIDKNDVSIKWSPHVFDDSVYFNSKVQSAFLWLADFLVKRIRIYLETENVNILRGIGDHLIIGDDTPLEEMLLRSPFFFPEKRWQYALFKTIIPAENYLEDIDFLIKYSFSSLNSHVAMLTLQGKNLRNFSTIINSENATGEELYQIWEEMVFRQPNNNEFLKELLYNAIQHLPIFQNAYLRIHHIIQGDPYISHPEETELITLPRSVKNRIMTQEDKQLLIDIINQYLKEVRGDVRPSFFKNILSALFSPETPNNILKNAMIFLLDINQ